MKNMILLLIILLFSITLLNANSIFTLYGMPIETYGVDSYGLGMGETGISDFFRTNSTYSNPALMATSSKISVTTSSTFGFVWYRDSKSEFRDDFQYFPYFNIAIPLKNHKLGFSFNSLFSGNFKTQQDLVLSDAGNEYNYTEIHRIDSGVYKTSLLYAFRNKYLNIGISGDIYLGHRIKYWKVDFKDDYFVDATYEHEEDLKNFGYGVGVGRKIGDFAVGAFYKSTSELYGQVVNRYIFSPGADTLADKQENLFFVPETMGLGVTYKKGVYKINLESIYENYTKDDKNAVNTYKYSFGLAYEPILGYGSWYNNIPLRLGLSYKTLPFKVNLSNVVEKKITFGFTIPLYRNQKIDFAISAFRRGDINKNEIEDKGISLNIGINAFDIFTKRHRRIKPREIPKKEF